MFGGKDYVLGVRIKIVRSERLEVKGFKGMGGKEFGVGSKRMRCPMGRLRCFSRPLPAGQRSS